MIRLDHYPEPVSPTGNIASEGIRNQLGRPDMDRLELLVREAVQNSWDARIGNQTVCVRISTHECSDDEFRFLKQAVFAEHSGFDDASNVTAAKSARMLVIQDRGTSGLGGPLRADRAHGDEPHDFVDFLRDIGQPPDKEFGGGTFGYGKTALYLKSSVYTIVVYSRCQHGSDNQSRFMVAALGESFREDGKKYTGRHWWGRIADDGVVDPLLDGDADEAARRLGLPTFASEERGTTIAILAPDFGEKRTARTAMNYVVHTLLWNFWPKMIRQPAGQPTMRFTVSCYGADIPVPDPETVAPFRGFVEAYRALNNGPGSDAFGLVEDVECLKPQRHLGLLSLRKFPHQPRRLPELSSADEEDPLIPARSHHVALLRVPELVVKYVDGPQLHSEQLEYGGVFRANRDMDRIYARSEPPSHDDWVNKALEDWSEKRYVGSTFTRISEQLQIFAGPRKPDMAGDGGGISLGRLGEHLSPLLPAVGGPSARVPGTDGNGPSGGGGGGSRTSVPRARVSVVGGARLVETSDGAGLEVEFEVNHADRSGGTRLTAKPAAILDSGEREREPPAGSPVPEVLEWTIGGERFDGSAEIYLENTNAGQSVSGKVLISVPPETSVGLELTASAEES